MDGVLWWILGAVVLATAVCAAWLLFRVVSARRVLLDAGVPFRDKALFWAAVLYTVSPLDVLPDPVYLDDIGVLVVALRALHVAARQATRDQHC
ncbi:YkvA family protein [Streptomyces sp. NPDC057445]|uniref:YkvA family protein n=1 Tax=Streptomyces sp. NPDC057445 TaxID=3346136 RepID=UPI003679382A